MKTTAPSIPTMSVAGRVIVGNSGVGIGSGTTQDSTITGRIYLAGWWGTWFHEGTGKPEQVS